MFKIVNIFIRVAVLAILTDCLLSLITGAGFGHPLNEGNSELLHDWRTYVSVALTVLIAAGYVKLSVDQARENALRASGLPVPAQTKGLIPGLQLAHSPVLVSVLGKVIAPVLGDAVQSGSGRFELHEEGLYFSYLSHRLSSSHGLVPWHDITHWGTESQGPLGLLRVEFKTLPRGCATLHVKNASQLAKLNDVATRFLGPTVLKRP